jgi:hypothetical protein
VGFPTQNEPLAALIAGCPNLGKFVKNVLSVNAVGLETAGVASNEKRANTVRRLGEEAISTDLCDYAKT